MNDVVVGNTFLQSVYNAPFLTYEEEVALAKKLKHEQCMLSAQKLILSHIRFVVKIARGYRGYGLPEEDLVQEGTVGLMKAVRNFDVDVGVRLVTYAIPFVKSQILEYILANWRIVKIATTKAYRKLFYNLRSLKESLGAVTEHEVLSISQKLNVKPEEVREMDKYMHNSDDQWSNDEDYRHVKQLADSRTEPLNLLLTYESDKTVEVYKALDILDERSKDIVKSRWLIEQPMTLHELGAKYGISHERVRQIEVAAMKKLKGQLA